MTHLLKNARGKLYAGLAFFGALILAITLVLTNSNLSMALLPGRASGVDYSITLDSSNKVTSAGDHVQHTKKGSNVTFTYDSIASSTSGHVTLNSGGSVVNKDQITSISSITATFSGTGTLKCRIAYVNETAKWGDYFTLVSGSRVDTDANPYYMELKADGGSVTITSAVYGFTCTTNPDAETQDTSGSYDITFSTGSGTNDGSSELTSSTFWDEVVSGDSYISSVSLSKVFHGKANTGLKFASNNYEGSLGLDFDSSYVQNNITTIDISTKQYGTKTSVFHVYVNGSSSYTTITPSAGGSVTVNGKLESLLIETSGKQAYLCGITLNYGGTVEPGQPDNPTAYEVGFSASDANKNSYTTNSIFANDNALVVNSIKSDSTQTTLSSSDYSYVITNANDQIIDPTEKFPAEGVYTLTVSYGSYIPQEITLNVGEYVYITDVSAAMTQVSFTTADILSNNLEGKLTANLEYSNNTSSSAIAYSEFASNGLGIKLLNPKGIAYTITNPFGTAGTWTLKVYNLIDENMYYNISLTVSAIPVTNIAMSEASISMQVEGTHQLNATVQPSNATNQDYVWASLDESVATVSESGLVTAVAVGGTTITATAQDGSGVYGSCTVTVSAKPSTTDYDIDATTTDQVTTNSTSSVVFTNSPVTVTIAKNSSSTNANNYVASGTTNHTRAYSGQRFTVSAGGSSMSSIVIHGTSDKGVSGFTSPTWTNATKSYSGNEVTITPTDPTSDVYCTVSGTVSFSGVTVTVGGGSGGSSTPIYPTSISLSAESSSISIGATTQLTVGYTPSETNVRNVTYSSSNTSIATVSNTGLVTGIAQGSATITATAQTSSGTTSATTTITVTPIAVTSVSLSSNSETIKVGKTVTLVPTISPSNATNKNVTWSSSDTSIATVSGGTVTGVAAGTATITVTTVDGSKTATCTVVVQESSAGGEETFSITYTDLPSTYQTGSTVYTADSGIKFQAYNCANYSSKMQFKASSGYLQTTEELELQSVTINDRESNTLTVYGSNTAGSFSTTITGTNDVYDLTGYSYFKIARTASGAAYCSSITVVTGTPTPTDPTSILLSPTSAEIAPGGTKQLSVSYVPSNANQNKDVTWTSSNTNVATVSSDGLVSVKSTATAGQSATITAKLTNITSIQATCSITVVEQTKDDHTVLIYMCGADLESENQLATGDIQEILKVSGQPDDVNIVIETGGASSWASTYGISSTYLERYHVENKSLVRDNQLTYASMGLTSTLQSFIEYGLNNFPAERTGLVFWNHGGGMRGVCYDEKKNDDALKNSEIRSAVSGALSNCGMSGQKLEWVGYDACLMAVQDIAVTNAEYFNYMIASEESEAGYGWDYDTWVDDLYSKKTTTTILKAIVDGFISDNGGASSSSGDQTLSYMNLSYAAAYKTAWENLASQLNSVVTSSNKSSFNSAITSNVKHYADSDYDYFCTFDAWDFVDKLANNSAFSSFSVDSSYITAVKNAHANLVAYNLAQKGAGVSKGLCMYWPNSTQYSDVSTYYTTSETTLTTWRSFCVNKGYHA